MSILNLQHNAMVPDEELATLLGQELFTQDEARLREHSETIAKDPSLCQTYVNSVLASRTRHEDLKYDHVVTTAASNAISILNYGSRTGIFPFRFIDVRDWSRIRVPGANLNYAVLPHCNLDDVDLSNSSIAHIVLYSTSLRRANLSGVGTSIRSLFYLADDLSIFAISPNGIVLARSKSSANGLHMFDIKTNKSVGYLRGFITSMIGPRFSRDGSHFLTILSGEPTTLHVWNLNTEAYNVVTPTSDTPSRLYGLTTSFSSDNRRIATVWSDGTVRIWDLETSQFDAQVFKHSDVRHVDWSPNDALIATCSCARLNGLICVWDVATSECILQIRGNTEHGSNFQFSSDGHKILLCISRGQICIWDVATGKQEAILSGQPDLDGREASVSGVVCDLNGRHAYSRTGDVWDRWVRVWDLETRECIDQFDYGFSQRDLVGTVDGQGLITYAPGYGFQQPVVVWNINSVRSWQPAMTDVRSLYIALSPDGRYFATALANKDVCIYDSATGRCDATIPCPAGADEDDVVYGPQYSFDGRKLGYYITYGTKVYLWDVEKREHITELAGSSHITSIRFSPKANVLAVAYKSSGVRLWDLDASECTLLCEQKDEISWLDFSPDGSILAIAAHKMLQLWDIATNECILTIQDEFISPDYLRYSICGRFLACGGKTLKVWCTKTGKCVVAVDMNGYSRLGFHPSGQVIILASQKLGMLERVSKTLRSTQLRKTPFGSTSWDRVFLASDGRTMIVRALDTLEFWQFPGEPWKSRILVENCDSKVPIAIATTQQADISLADPQGYAIASGSSEDGSVLFQGALSELPSISTKHSDIVTCMASSPNGKYFASGSRDNTIRLWEVTTKECSGVLEGHLGAVTVMQFSHDSELIASGSDDTTIRIWSVSEIKCIVQLDGHPSGIRQVAFSPDKTYVASIGAADNTVRIWDIATGSCSMVLSQHDDEVFDIQFTVDGAYLASGSHDDTIRVWEVKTGECVATLKGHMDCLTCFALSSDGKTVISGSEDQTIRVWNVTTGECRFVLGGHTGYVRTLLLTPDNQCLISTSSEDNSIHVWSLTTGEMLHELHGHTDRISSVKLIHYDDQGESVIVSTSRDGTLRIWAICQLLSGFRCVPELQNVIGKQRHMNLVGADFTEARMDHHFSKLIKFYGGGGVIEEPE